MVDFLGRRLLVVHDFTPHLELLAAVLFWDTPCTILTNKPVYLHFHFLQIDCELLFEISPPFSNWGYTDV